MTKERKCSPFNEEQIDYMRALAEVLPEMKCWCGWYRLGQCFNCSIYAPEKTNADKIFSLEREKRR